MTTTAAQEEFSKLFDDAFESGKTHPEDRTSDSPPPTHSADEGASRKVIRGGKKQSTPDSEDDETAAAQGTSSSSKMRTPYFLPRGSHRSDANTGPKGVIADAIAFETAKKKARRISLPFGGRSNNAATTATPAAASHLRRDAEKDGDQASEDDEDDEFMQRWRQSRLRELAAVAPGAGGRKTSPSGRRWGTMQTVDGEGYLDAVDRSARGAVVVVLIYDDASEVSDAVERSVRQLAKVYTSTRFVRLHYEEAEMESMGVPAILAYRDGEKFAGLVPVIDEIPEELELNPDSLDMVLRKHHILA